VTLHDFNIALKGSNANSLQMKIIAKTYRYKDDEGSP
jgi:type IV pilus assembly protein PilO